MGWCRLSYTGIAHCGVARGCRAATHFLCFAKESKQRKATPASPSPSGRKPMHRLPSFGRCYACFAKPLPHPSRRRDDRPIRKTRTRTLLSKRLCLCSSSNIRIGLPRSSLVQQARSMLRETPASPRRLKWGIQKPSQRQKQIQKPSQTDLDSRLRGNDENDCSTRLVILVPHCNESNNSL